MSHGASGGVRSQTQSTKLMERGYNPYDDVSCPSSVSSEEATSAEELAFIEQRACLLASGKWKTLKSLPYDDFLQTSEWRVVRDYVTWKLKHCQFCGKTSHLNVHHKRYVRNGADLVDPEAYLTVLCRQCHVKFHVGERELASAERENRLSRHSDNLAPPELVARLARFGVTFRGKATERRVCQAIESLQTQIVFCDRCQVGNFASRENCEHCNSILRHPRVEWFPNGGAILKKPLPVRVMPNQN